MLEWNLHPLASAKNLVVPAFFFYFIGCGLCAYNAPIHSNDSKPLINASVHFCSWEISFTFEFLVRCKKLIFQYLFSTDLSVMRQQPAGPDW